jgi:hypothetical protein
MRNTPLAQKAITRAIPIALIASVWSSTTWSSEFFIKRKGSPAFPGKAALEVEDSTSEQANNIFKFDDYMRGISSASPSDPEVKINIGPGTYRTRGFINDAACYDTVNGVQIPWGYRLKNGWNIIGAGKGDAIGGTTLKLQAINRKFENWVIGADANDNLTSVTVSKLEVDCNANALMPAGANSTISGIVVFGNGNGTINLTDLQVVHAGSVLEENFILAINAATRPTIPPIAGQNYITRCTVKSVDKGSCSAISLNWRTDVVGVIQGEITGCDVTFAANSGHQQYAYNATRTINSRIAGNTSTNAVRAFNNDTAFNENMLVENNAFEIPYLCTGIKLINGMRNSRFINNQLKIAGPGAIGFHISGPFRYPYDLTGNRGVNDLLFQDNQVTIAYSGAEAQSWGFYMDDVDQGGRTGGSPYAHHVSLVHNTVDSRVDNRITRVLPSNETVGYMTNNVGTHFPVINELTDPSVWKYPATLPLLDCSHTLNADIRHNSYSALVFEQMSSTAMKAWYMLPVFKTNGVPAAQYEQVITDINGNPTGVGGSWRIAGTGDLNGDGHIDLVFQDSVGGLGFWLLTGTPTDAAAYRQLQGNLIYDAAGSACNPGVSYKVVGVGDFDGDLQPDLVFQLDGGRIGVMYLTWDPYACVVRSKGAPQDFATQPGSADWRIVGVADFNRDGKPDLLWQNRSEDPNAKSALILWLMNRTTLLTGQNIDPYQPFDNLDYPGYTFIDPDTKIGQATYRVPDDLNWRVVAVGDFDGDFWPDIAFQKKSAMNIPGGEIMLWSMVGNLKVARVPQKWYLQPRPDNWPAYPDRTAIGTFDAVGPK